MSNLSDLLPSGAGGKSFDFVASGTLASGQTVGLTSDGKVEAIAGVTENVGSSTQISTGNFAYPVGVYDTTNDKVVVLYSGPSNRAYAVVGDVSGTSISFGSEVEAVNDTCYYQAGAFDSNTGKVLLCYADYSNGEIGNAVVGTVSGTSISFGSVTTFNTASTSYISAIYDPSAQKIVIGYKDSSSGGRLIAATISGTSVSFGSEYNFNSGTTTFISLSYDSSQNKILVFYRDGGNSNYPTCIVASLSGTAFSFGSEVILVSRATENHGSSYTANGKHLLVYRNDGSPNNLSSVVIATVSGTSVSFGTETATTVRFSTAPYVPVVYDSLANKVIIFGRNQDNSYYPTYLVATISGTAITLDSPVVVQSVTSYEQAACYDPDEQKSVFFWPTSSRNIPVGAVFTVGSTNVSSYVGITEAAISDTATGTVTLQGGVSTGGNLLPYAPSFGTASEFSAANTTKTAVAFDSSNNKIVVVYNNPSDSLYGTAIVGTVSGSSITYGSPFRLRTSSINYPTVTFDSTANKVNIVFTNDLNSNRLECMTGTISGTSISAASAILVNGSNGATYVSSAFDVNANRLVICWVNTSNSSYGTAAVGTYNSGTGQQGFGSPVVFNSGTTSACAAVYDSNSNKVVTAYQDSGNSGHGTAIVGTVSGTSISFGSEAVFESANSFLMAGTFDSNANKAVFTYQSGSKGKAVVGTVSGTSISFGSSVNFDESSASLMSNSFDTSSNKVVICFQDTANSNVGTAVFGTVSGTSISFAASSAFVGGGITSNISTTFDSNVNKTIVTFVDGSDSTKGKALTITESNALTIGSTYYVQDDGTLGTGSTSIVAGEALSATSINLVNT